MVFSVVLFDDLIARNHLLPLVATRPIGNLRVGILTINKKWESIFNTDVSYLTVDYLRDKFSINTFSDRELLVIKGSVLPNDSLLEALPSLTLNQQLVDKAGEWIAVKVVQGAHFNAETLEGYEKVELQGDVNRILFPEDIFLNNASQILFDLQLMNIKPNEVSSTNTIIGNDLYIAQNTAINGAVLDTTKGPIYVGEGAVIEPNVVIYGPVSIGANCRVKSGAVIYPNVTIGEFSTVGGELNNVVIWGNSAKGHAGYLGCAVVGEGCNLGAGTTNSNLKNDWSTVKLYDYAINGLRDTTLQKCGVVIGDQVMLGIHSMLTTGTIIGVGAQVAMSKFIPKFVPDFCWLTDHKCETYLFSRFEDMMKRKALLKKEKLTDHDMMILSYIHQDTKELRENNQH